jgi:EAL domain-containing protein (putative c-di-GMP-specific phosphodiesterase class I)
VLGFEGLIRPTDAAPFANPGALFKAAEAAGRTIELDAACFEVVTRAATTTDPRKVVSINLSPRTIEAADFNPAAVVASMVSLGFQPGRLIIELTEREVVQDMPRLRRNLTELQQAGIRIAADDVGAGNAGLRLLAQFRFDIVKIDLSLVQEGAERDSSHAVLRSLRDLAARQGAFVIAEGIETAEQLRVVRELGLSAGQGYLLGRPSPNVDLPGIDLVALEAGEQMLQNAPVPIPDHPEGALRPA